MADLDIVSSCSIRVHGTDTSLRDEAGSEYECLNGHERQDCSGALLQPGKATLRGLASLLEEGRGGSELPFPFFFPSSPFA